jgi:hypothetical protein
MGAMKKFWIGLLFFLILLTACQSLMETSGSASTSSLPAEVATLIHPAASPSGQYTLQVLQADNQKLSFFILDASGKKIYAAADQFSTRNKTYFLWDSNDRVWVDAGDDQIYFWQNNNGKWKKTDYSSSNETLPSFLQQAHPVQH